MKSIYIFFYLMELIQNVLTRTPAKGINITFRVSKFDLELPIKGMREIKSNLKERFAIFVKKEKFHPRWDSNPQPLN